MVKIKFMKKFYTLLFLFIISFTGLDAQQMTGLAAFVKSGFYTLSSSCSSSLNKIVPAGFSLHSTFVTLGGEGYYRNNKMLFILDGNIGLENSTIISFQEVKVFSEALYTKAGWIVKEKKHYWVYPSIGIGIASLDINTSDTKK